MAHARIHVDLPATTWKGELTRECPETAVCLPATTLREDWSIEIADIGDDLGESRLDSLRGHEDIRDVAVVERAADRTTVRIETANPVVASAAHRSQTPLSYPIDVQAGSATVDVVSTHDCISAFGERLSAAGLQFEVESIQSRRETCEPLTERQRELLLAGLEHGYYETPRQCSLTALAAEMDIAKSTCSGTLQRAEGALVEQFFAGAPQSRPPRAEESLRERSPGGQSSD